MQTRFIFLVVAITIGLSACASGPDIDLERYDRVVTPDNAAANFDLHSGKEVLWGGLIVGISNLDKGTEIEVLGYPLVGKAEPDSRREPIGRFIVRSEKFVEPLEYAPGKELTVAGRITDTTSGQVGGTQYIYPVLAPDDLFLWSGRRSRVQPQVGFGFGFIFGS